MRRFLVLAAAMLLVVAQAGAKVITEPIEYKAGDATCQGWVSWDDAVKGRRPGVLIVHDWMGATDHQKEQAERLAALGYVGFVADVYGKGVRPADAQGAREASGKFYQDPALFRARLTAGLDALTHRPEADASRLAAIGYCFGGAGALQLAYTGAPLRGIVTFHGSLPAPDSTEAKAIRAKVLMLHGADDPFVKPEAVRTLMDDLRAAHVDYQVVQYSGAVHSFTDARAGNDNSKGAAYNANADRRSWLAMRNFLEEVFAK